MAHLSFVIGLDRSHEFWDHYESGSGADWEQIGKGSGADQEWIYSDLMSLRLTQRDHMTLEVDLLSIPFQSALYAEPSEWLRQIRS